MRLVAGGTTYLARGGWREMAELVSMDARCAFEEMPEDVLVRLYEQGRWWDWSTWKRPGVIRLREMITCGGLPYVAYQAFSEEELVAGHGDVSLVDYLGGRCRSGHRGGNWVYMDLRGGLIEGCDHFSDGDCLSACSKLASMLRDEKICRERLPPSLLAVAERAYARASTSFFGTGLYVDRSSHRGPECELPVYRVLGPGRVFVLSAGVPEVLRGAGIKLRRERRMGVPCVGGKFFRDLWDLWSSSEVLHGPGETVVPYYDNGYPCLPETVLPYLADPQRAAHEIRNEFTCGKKFIVVREERGDGGSELIRRIAERMEGVKR